MRAVVMTHLGGPEVLEHREMPEPGPPGPGQVLVAVRAAGLSRLDVKSRRLARPWAPIPMPAVVGYEGAGVVVAVGDGVAHLGVGDAVFYVGAGSCCDLQVVDASHAGRVPAGFSFVEAAALPMAACVWFQVRERTRVQDGQVAIVCGSAGGVGVPLIRAFAAEGVQIVATGRGRDLEFLKEQGAALAFDHEHDDWVAAVLEATDGAGADVAIDLIGARTIEECTRAVSPRGRLAAYVDIAGDLSGGSARNQTLELCMLEARHDALDAFAALAVRPHVMATFPLEKTAEAHALLETGGVRGKIVLEL